MCPVWFGADFVDVQISEKANGGPCFKDALYHRYIVWYYYTKAWYSIGIVTFWKWAIHYTPTIPNILIDWKLKPEALT